MIQLIFLLLAGVGTGLALVEGILRWGIVDNPVYRRLTPVAPNSHPRGKVMIVGPSTIFKNGRLDALLVKMLAPRQLEVLNLAEQGTGPLDFVENCRIHLGKYRPDILIYCMAITNSITHTMRRLNENRVKTVSRAFLNRLYLFRLLRPMLFRRPAVPRTSDVDPHLAGLARRGEFNVYLLAMPRPLKARFVTDNLLLASPESQRAAARVEQTIREVQDLCQKHGSKLLLVLCPDSNQVNRSQFDYYLRAGFALDERTLATDVPQQRWKAVADSMKVPVLDMLPQFRARGSESLYLEYDPHLNAAGTGVAAELIMQELVKVLPQSGFLP